MQLQVRQGSIIDDLAESEPAYLAKQNKELRRLLVECRKELYEVVNNHFAFHYLPFRPSLGPFCSNVPCHRLPSTLPSHQAV